MRGVCFLLLWVLPVSEYDKEQISKMVTDDDRINTETFTQAKLTRLASILAQSWSLIPTLSSQNPRSLFLLPTPTPSSDFKENWPQLCHTNATKATSNHRHLRDPSIVFIATFRVVPTYKFDEKVRILAMDMLPGKLECI